MEIQAGKFYRSRDGRKIGPMVERIMHWQKGITRFWSDVGGAYYYDGQHISNSANDLISEWQDEPETGTLQELNVKPGDVVELMTGHYKGRICTVRRDMGVRFRMSDGTMNGYTWPVAHIFRIISRAGVSEEATPRTWREMTDAEKGALLLAAHEGKVIEDYDHYLGKWREMPSCQTFRNGLAYRIRPEPKRETVRLIRKTSDTVWEVMGTMELSDGKPDCASIKMEEL